MNFKITRGAKITPEEKKPRELSMNLGRSPLPGPSGHARRRPCPSGLALPSAKAVPTCTEATLKKKNSFNTVN